MTTPRIVKVGVLGAGAWARSAHLPGYRRDPRCRVVAIADTELERAQAAATEFDIATVTTDARELLDRADIDLIDVCTPSHTHFELAWAALEAGKHVLCEKPVAYDYRDTIRRPRSREAEGPEDESRPDLPLQPGDALHAGAGRRRLHRHAVHLQRLRTELAVARPEEPAAAGGPHRRSVGDSGVVAGGLRRADHRPGASDGRRRLEGSRRHDAQLHPGADGARDQPHDAHEHRRRRHLPRRVRQRRAVLDPDELRHRRQLSRHRGAAVRK